jgi:hypothetical protein
VGWTGWTIAGSAIAMGVLVALGVAYAVLKGLRLKRRVSWASRTVDPILAGIGAGVDDIGRGVARAEAGAADLSHEVEDLRVSVLELRVIGHHLLLALQDLRGPLGWIAGVRALIRFRGR